MTDDTVSETGKADITVRGGKSGKRNSIIKIQNKFAKGNYLSFNCSGRRTALLKDNAGHGDFIGEMNTVWIFTGK